MLHHIYLEFSTGLLSDGMPASTPPVSPSRLLKENENQWLNSEVADFSLSSFLGHLESPMKSTSNEEVSQEVSAEFFFNDWIKCFK